MFGPDQSDGPRPLFLKSDGLSRGRLSGLPLTRLIWAGLLLFSEAGSQQLAVVPSLDIQ